MLWYMCAFYSKAGQGSCMVRWSNRGLRVLDITMASWVQRSPSLSVYSSPLQSQTNTLKSFTTEEKSSVDKYDKLLKSYFAEVIAVDYVKLQQPMLQEQLFWLRKLHCIVFMKIIKAIVVQVHLKQRLHKQHFFHSLLGNAHGKLWLAP